MAESGQVVDGRVERMCKLCLNRDINRSADIFCSTCNEFQCNECSKIHEMKPYMKNHKFIHLHDGKIKVSRSNGDIVDMNGIDICEKHEKTFEFFCKDDKLLLCSTCAIIDHRHCENIVEIQTIAENGQCESLKEEVRTAITTMNQTVENLKEAESRLTYDIHCVPEKLSEIKKISNQMFDACAKEVTKVATSYRDKTTAKWAKSKLECETKINTLNSALKTIDNVAGRGTASQKIITVHSMRETIQTEMKNADSLNADFGTINVSCNFDEQFETLRSGLLSAMKSGEFEINDSLPKITKLAPITSIALKQTGDDMEEPLYTGLDFLPDGRLVVVDNLNHKCLLYDENLNLKSAFKLPYRLPYSLVAVSDEDVVTTSGGEHRLDFLHVSKTNEISFNRTCEVNVRYDSICMKDDDHLVVSTIDHNTPVRIVTMSGEEKDLDIVFPPKSYPIDSSFCTYVRGHDKVVLTDRDADTVYIYDVKTDEKVIVKHELIKKPCGVAVGPYGHVLGCSKSTGSLVEITPAGRLLTSHEVDMSFPRYLAVSKDRRRLAVTNAATGAKQLKLYQII